MELLIFFYPHEQYWLRKRDTVFLVGYAWTEHNYELILHIESWNTQITKYSLHSSQTHATQNLTFMHDSLLACVNHILHVSKEVVRTIAFTHFLYLKFNMVQHIQYHAYKLVNGITAYSQSSMKLNWQNQFHAYSLIPLTLIQRWKTSVMINQLTVHFSYLKQIYFQQL